MSVNLSSSIDLFRESSHRFDGQIEILDWERLADLINWEFTILEKPEGGVRNAEGCSCDRICYLLNQEGYELDVK